MNYLLGFGCCCSLGSNANEDIRMVENCKFVDVETNEIVDIIYLGNSYKEEHTYKYTKVWSINKGSTILKNYFSKEECEKAYNKLIDELREDNKVINV